MVIYQLGAEVNIWFDSLWLCRLLAVRVEPERQKWLPSVLKGLAHWAGDAVVIIADHRPNILSLGVVAALGRLVLLEAVKVESMAALRKGHSRLVVGVEDVC